MWRLGYLLWRTWLYTRVGTVGMVAGMRLVLRDLARLEGVGTGWRRR